MHFFVERRRVPNATRYHYVVLNIVEGRTVAEFDDPSEAYDYAAWRNGKLPETYPHWGDA